MVYAWSVLPGLACPRFRGSPGAGPPPRQLLSLRDRETRLSAPGERANERSEARKGGAREGRETPFRCGPTSARL